MVKYETVGVCQSCAYFQYGSIINAVPVPAIPHYLFTFLTEILQFIWYRDEMSLEELHGMIMYMLHIYQLSLDKQSLFVSIKPLFASIYD